MIGKYRVRIMASASDDIKTIYNYILLNFGIDNAHNTIRAIKEKILGLKLVPKAGTLFNKEPWMAKGLRLIHIRNYSIFYYVSDKSQTVKVIKVAYSKMNFDDLFKTSN